MNFKAAVAAFALLFSSSFLIAAQEAPVWRVGRFDGSSAEFNQDQPHAAVVFEAGRSNQSAEWYAYAPSAFPGKPNTLETAPRTITFSLSASPQRAYRLRVSLIIEYSSVPDLGITINGRRGRFVLHPKLDSSMGDTMDAFFPAYSRVEADCDFPGSWLVSGRNEIALQALSVSDEGVPDSGFNYDAIDLDRLAQLPPETARAEPTIFYRSHGGSLEERVDVFVRYALRPRSGRVTLQMAGHSWSGQLDPDEDFGEQRVRFWVPEFPPGTTTRVETGGNRHGFTQTPGPQKKWTLYLVPHVHLDIGYTDYQAKVAAIQSRVLDEAMEMVRKDPGFRFRTDG